MALVKTKDYRMQEYLTSSELNTDEKQLLFHLHNGTYECKSNFKSQYGSDLACNICLEEDSQQHLTLQVSKSK